MHPHDFFGKIFCRVGFDMIEIFDDDIKSELMNVQPKNFIKTRITLPVYKIEISYITDRNNYKKRVKYMVMDKPLDSDSESEYWADEMARIFSEDTFEKTSVCNLKGCIALWAQSPFDKILACSNMKMYRYEWIIEKTKATGHLNAKKMPMKAHENVLIFYKSLPTYNPQKTSGHEPVHNYTKHTDCGSCYGKTETGISGGGSTERYPRDVLSFKWDTQKSSLVPTQKPVEACKYFIRTYTNPGDTVLDNCMGSNSTGVACKELDRKYIGIELLDKHFEIAVKRVS